MIYHITLLNDRLQPVADEQIDERVKPRRIDFFRMKTNLYFHFGVSSEKTWWMIL
jgi:hypothetical protein